MLSDIRPRTLVVLRCLRDGCPVVIEDTEAGAYRRVLRQAVRQTQTRPPVGGRVVVNLAGRRNHNVVGQFAIPGNAGRTPALGARRRQFLNDVRSIIEVDRTSLDASVLADRFRLAVWRNECSIVAKAKVHSELWGGLPRILEIEAHGTAPSRSFMHVPASRAIWHVQKEGGDRVAGVDVGLRRIRRLLQGKSRVSAVV